VSVTLVSSYNHREVTLKPVKQEILMSNEHGNLIKSPKQLIIMVFASFFVPLVIILLLMVYVNSGQRTDAAASIDQIIKPVGQLNFQDASAPPDAKAPDAK